MDIIKYGNLYKEEKKVKAKCPYCGTKVAMTKNDYKLFDYQTNLLWTCPFCEKEVITKRFNIYRVWDKIRKWYDSNFIAGTLVLTFGIGVLIVVLALFIVFSVTGPDDTDKYYIDFCCINGYYQYYIDDCKLEGDTLYIWDNGEKITYMKATIEEVRELKEEE